ncbi:MAG: hypothetical protein QME25_09185 [Bacteroidota bacterium]|nr:hypothetical protein [Bacteroidota bacterium]
MYLTEVEYYRNNRERLTDLQWAFYLYGPYTKEVENILDSPPFEKSLVETKDSKEFIKYNIAEPTYTYQRYVDVKLSLLIKKIVGQWKDKTLAELLDYVYFETEPMKAVKQRGEKLDFNMIKSIDEIPPIIPLKASKEAEKKVAELRKKIKPFLESVGHQQAEDLAPSTDYIEAMKAWIEEEDPTIIIPPNLIIHVTKPSDNSAYEGN